MKKSSGEHKAIAKNKKAYHEYHICEKYEAGIELQGTEVKSIRQGKVSLTEAYCTIRKDKELYINQMNITSYDNAGYCNHDPIRKRRLLMHRREIMKLRTKLLIKGYTLVPLSLYFKRGWAKIELGLAKGKRKYDKREAIKKREIKRELQRY